MCESAVRPSLHPAIAQHFRSTFTYAPTLKEVNVRARTAMARRNRKLLKILFQVNITEAVTSEQ
jgi:hypothetical protein